MLAYCTLQVACHGLFSTGLCGAVPGVMQGLLGAQKAGSADSAGPWLSCNNWHSRRQPLCGQAEAPVAAKRAQQATGAGRALNPTAADAWATVPGPQNTSTMVGCCCACCACWHCCCCCCCTAATAQPPPLGPAAAAASARSAAAAAARGDEPHGRAQPLHQDAALAVALGMAGGAGEGTPSMGGTYSCQRRLEVSKA